MNRKYNNLLLCFSDCKEKVAADYAVDAKPRKLLWEKRIEMTQLQPEKSCHREKEKY